MQIEETEKIELERSFLIQRLIKSRPGTPEAPISIRSLIATSPAKGPLPGLAIATLSAHVIFDYMGSAEFEFGAIPESLRRICEQPMKRVYFELNTSHIKPDSDLACFAICPEGVDGAELIERVHNLMHEHCRTKETVGLSKSVINTITRKILSPMDPVGWFDIDNDFLFFLDEDMFSRFSTMLV